MIFLQKKPFRGQQEFRLLEDNKLRVTLKGGGGERSYTVSLLEIDPNYARIKTGAYGFLIAAYPTAIFAAFMLLAALLQRSTAEVIQGLIVGVVFGGIAFFCFRENSRKVTDIVAFYSRVHGKAILTPWYGNPNPAAFETFLKELTDRVKVAIERVSEAPRAQANTMAGEILALKKLVDDGVLSAAEFERAKGKLLEPAGERRPIGFGG